MRAALRRMAVVFVLGAYAAGVAALSPPAPLPLRLDAARAAVARADTAKPPRPFEQAAAVERLFDRLDEAWQLETDEAQKLVDRDLSLRHRDAAQGSTAYALALERKARLQYASGNLTAAETTGRQALAMAQQQNPPDEDALASIRITLGSTLSAMQSRFEEAAPILQEAVAQLDRTKTHDLRLVRALQVLAYDFRYMSRLDDAQTTIDRALNLATELRGPQSVFAADSLTISAMVARSHDDVAHAVELLDRALTILRQTEPRAQASYSRALLLLAQTLRPSGDHKRAEELYREGVAAEEPHPSAGGARLGGFLTGVGLCLEDDDRYAEAIPYLERGLALYRKVYGPDSAGTMSVEISLAPAYELTGHPDKAVAMLSHVAEVSDRAPVGSSLRVRMNAREGLGDILVHQGRYKEAEGQYRRYLDQIGHDHILGEINPRASREGLAAALWGQGRNDEAFAVAVDAERLEQQLLRTSGADVGEHHAIGLREYTHGALDWALAIAAQKSKPARTRAAWELALESRGIVGTISARRLAAARAARDPKLAAAWSAWKARNEALVQARVNAARDPSPGTTDALAAAEGEFDAAERALAHAAGARGAALTHAHQGLDAVIAALPADSLLVSYIEAAHTQPRDQAQGAGKLHPRLYAFVTRRSAQPQLIDLGPGSAVDSSVQAWLTLVTDRAAGAAARDAAGRRLRELIWDPIAAKWPQRRVLVVPSSMLERIPFAALPSPDGHFLVERGYAFHLLDHERDLLMTQMKMDSRATFSLIGAPDLSSVATGSGTRGVCAGLRGATFSALPQAEREIDELRELWAQRKDAPAPTVLEGANATEARARAALHGSNFIHFATHGIFLGDRCGESAADTRGIKTVDTASLAEDARDLSALILSGVNRPATNTEDDGLLTSEEISALDLTGTDWVVLSACDSGIGKNVAGEGVFGLRRAFRLAGAHSVVMSLWPVSDRATADWMLALYRARLRDHASTMDSVRSADLGLIRQRRDAGLDPSPFYWAAFVATGDWH